MELKTYMMSYEIIVYKYGSGIYNNNDDMSTKRYRQNVEEKLRINVDKIKIYEEKLPKRQIIYIYENRVTYEPVIDLFFVSDASLNRFLTQNPLIKKRVGKDYFLNSVIHSHEDCRAV